MRCLAVLLLLAALLPVAPTACAQPPEDGATKLATAIDSGSVAAVRRVLDEGVPPNVLVGGTPALSWAVWERRLYVARLLVDRGANVNLPDAEGFTPLMAAGVVGQLPMVQLLLEHGADVNAVEDRYGMSVLQAACEGGSDAVVQLLLEHGAEIEHTDRFGGNCLEEAAFYGHRRVVERLRAAGVTTRWPLHVAAGLGEVQQAQRLLAGESDVNVTNGPWKNTPLMFASGGGQVQMVEWLVARGADLHATNVLGATPLHVAAGADRLEVVRWLVDEGAAVNAAAEDGSTPLDWARATPVRRYLQQRGALSGEQPEGP